jgi:hypothetical protein
VHFGGVARGLRGDEAKKEGKVRYCADHGCGSCGSCGGPIDGRGNGGATMMFLYLGSFHLKENARAYSDGLTFTSMSFATMLLPWVRNRD